MTKRELLVILQVLQKIKNPDGRVAEAIAIVQKKQAQYDSRRGQLKDSYDYDYFKGWG